jgi:hypothetical protein
LALIFQSIFLIIILTKTSEEEKFIAYDIGTDYEGTESYLLIMQTKTVLCQQHIMERLIRVVENYKDVRLPNEVIFQNLP